MVAVPQQPTAGAPDDTDLLSFYPADGSAPKTRELKGGLLPWLKRTLAGRDEDFYGSFQNASAFLAAGTLERRGEWSIANVAAGAPDVDDDILLSQIVDGNYTVCFSTRMRSDPDNNVWALAARTTAADFPVGRKIVGRVPGVASRYATMTLTAAGTVVGAGDAEYVYAAATIDEVGDLFDHDDWNVFSEVVPPDIGIDSALIRSLGSLWDRMLVTLEGTASILKRARQIIQGNNETQTLSVTRVAGNPAAAGEIYLGNLANGIGQLLFWPPSATKDGTAFELEDLREYQSGDFLSYGGLEWEIGAQPWVTFQGSILTATVMLADGYVYDAADVPALNAAADFVLEGRDIHLGLVVAAILKRAANNLGGKGGAAGKIWAYLSSDTDATWRRLLDVLKADADTAAKRGDYHAALGPSAKVLVNGASTQISKNWTQVDLGAAEDYGDYSILAVTLKEQADRKDTTTAWFSTSRIAALDAASVAGQTWYDNARDPYIEPATSDIAGGKIILGKGAAGRYVMLAHDKNAAENYDLTIEGIR